jgi:hypothetical protein
MTEEMRGSIIAIAQRAFNAPVNHHGKLYQTIADSIRSEFEKEHDAFFAGRCSSSSGGGVNDSSSRVGAAANNLGVKSAGSGGWSCVVGGECKVVAVASQISLLSLDRVRFMGPTSLFSFSSTDAFGSSVTHRMKTYM